MAEAEFAAGLDCIRRAIITALREFGVTLLPGEISHQPLTPGRVPDELSLSLAPKDAAFVTGTFTRDEIEACVRGVERADVREKVGRIADKYSKRPPG